MNLTSLTAAIPILLVDDRVENLLSLEVLLIDQGYELVRATSGNEALLLTLKKDFALVLLDVQMPEMDGFETAELMRANPKTRHIPIIFVTAGMKDLQFQFKGYDAGAVDYLAKPLEPLFLRSKVFIFAEMYRQRLEIELHKHHLENLVEQRTIELRLSAAELEARNKELQQKNRALQDTEELLRKQVIEIGDTRDHLLATEEMLRVQITEYEAAQKQLNKANLNLQTLFDVSPLAIVVSSFPSGTIRQINHTFSNSFGYTEERVIGKRGIELGLWTDNAERERFLALMHKQRGITGFGTEIKTFDGENRAVVLYSNLIDYKDENCLLIVFLDVTEQKRMEDQIRQSQKMDVIGQLAGGVAHDFNNMLTAILGSAELMSRHIGGNSTAVKLLDNIQQAAGRSADLASQLLVFSHKRQKKSVNVTINSTVNDVISLLERTIDKNISLATQLTTVDSSITGDPTLLQNALLNLGVNARDAMPEGGVITFTSTNVKLDAGFCQLSGFEIIPGKYVEISVSDTGIGMTKDVIQHVFEPFFTTKAVGKGTGLGLAAVYSTVTDHSGCITIHSEPGIGTVFKIYLPLAVEENTEVALAEKLIHGTGGILLVDDEEMLRDIGQAILEDLGYRVYLAEQGEQALEIYAREKNDIVLVILDMVMPVLGGKETLRRLKAINPALPVLISSGIHQEGTAAELTMLGAKGFLQKPYSRLELCRVIADTIGGH